MIGEMEHFRWDFPPIYFYKGKPKLLLSLQSTFFYDKRSLKDLVYGLPLILWQPYLHEREGLGPLL